MPTFLSMLIGSLAPHPKPTPTSTNRRLRIKNPYTLSEPHGTNDQLEFSDAPLLQRKGSRQLPKYSKNPRNDQGIRAFQRSHVSHAQRSRYIVRKKGGSVGLQISGAATKRTFKSYRNQQMPVPKKARTNEMGRSFCGALSTSAASWFCSGAKATVREEERRIRTEQRGGRERTKSTPWIR